MWGQILWNVLEAAYEDDAAMMNLVLDYLLRRSVLSSHALISGRGGSEGEVPPGVAPALWGVLSSGRLSRIVSRGQVWAQAMTVVDRSLDFVVANVTQQSSLQQQLEDCTKVLGDQSTSVAADVVEEVVEDTSAVADVADGEGMDMEDSHNRRSSSGEEPTVVDSTADTIANIIANTTKKAEKVAATLEELSTILVTSVQSCQCVYRTSVVLILNAAFARREFLEASESTADEIALDGQLITLIALLKSILRSFEHAGRTISVITASSSRPSSTSLELTDVSGAQTGLLELYPRWELNEAQVTFVKTWSSFTL